MVKAPVSESLILGRLNTALSIQRRGQHLVKTSTGNPYAQIVETRKVVSEFKTRQDLIEYAKMMKCIEAWEEVSGAVRRTRKSKASPKTK